MGDVLIRMLHDMKSVSSREGIFVQWLMVDSRSPSARNRHEDGGARNCPGGNERGSGPCATLVGSGTHQA